MRGIPIDQVTIADLEQLIADGVTEGQHLEFKTDLPVHVQRQKEMLKADPSARPVERSWVEGRALADHGRDELLAEIVALANAEGGTLILGMEESDDLPHAAVRLNALPAIAHLERKLRDVILSQIDPQLPSATVRALETQADSSGIIIVEVASSALAPHRVRKTLVTTIRRGDRCDPLSMPEVHDMVLRNARRFGEVARRLGELEEELPEQLERTLRRRLTDQFSGPHAIERWLGHIHATAFGMQVHIVPHHPLGFARLEELTGLLSRAPLLSRADGQPVMRREAWAQVSPTGEDAAVIMGGARATWDWGNQIEGRCTVRRDGEVVIDLVRQGGAAISLEPELLIAAAARALDIFDRLRLRTSTPTAAAEIGAKIIAIRPIAVSGYGGSSRGSREGLPGGEVSFDRYTAGDRSSFGKIIGAMAGDLLNAGGLFAWNIPEFIWDSRESIVRAPGGA